MIKADQYHTEINGTASQLLTELSYIIEHLAKDMKEIGNSEDAIERSMQKVVEIGLEEMKKKETGDSGIVDEAMRILQEKRA
jgi:hypothetical protein